MANEEINHADNIRKLKAFAEDGKVVFNENMTNTLIVKLVIDDISDKYKKTEDNQ